jgi:2-(3-amino-3-carboxypropyl)histidine synthase
MDLAGYHIDLDKITTTIKSTHATTIALQLPEGLRPHALTLTTTLEHHTKATILICADPCYGACDLASNRLHGLTVDHIIHIGHTEIPSIHSTIPTTYINALSLRKPQAVIAKALPSLTGPRIGLVTTAQHLDSIQTAQQILLQENFIPVIGKGGPRIAFDGQVLGCDFSSATAIQDQVDSYLFIGSGMFHPIGLALATRKPVIAADPYTGEVHKDDLETLKNSLLKKRYAAIATAQTATRYGIIIGLKTGQQRLAYANRLRSQLNDKGKTTMLLLLDQCTPLILQSFSEIDCFVSTACPRIAIDDAAMYTKPVLTPIELEVVLGIRPWEDYVFDQITA